MKYKLPFPYNGGWVSHIKKGHKNLLDSSPVHTPVKKMRRITIIVNRELKKYAVLKSYSQYVEIKTAILRRISENEDTEDAEDYGYSSNNANLSDSSVSPIRTVPATVPRKLKINLNLRKVKTLTPPVNKIKFKSASAVSTKLQKQSRSNKITKKETTDLQTREKRKTQLTDEKTDELTTNVTVSSTGKEKSKCRSKVLQDTTKIIPPSSPQKEESNEKEKSVTKSLQEAKKNVTETLLEKDERKISEKDNAGKSTKNITKFSPQLEKAKRNLTYILDNLEDEADAMNLSQIIIPIAQSTQIIDNDDKNNTDVDDNEKIFEDTVGDENSLSSQYSAKDRIILSSLASGEDEDGDSIIFTPDTYDSNDKDSEIFEELITEKVEPYPNDTDEKLKRPVIKCTEIITSQYRIIRDDDEGSIPVGEVNNNSDSSLKHEDEVIEIGIVSPSTKRVGELKRLNLYASDSSDEEVTTLKKDSEPKENKISDSPLKQKNEVNQIDVRSPSTERVDEPKRLILNANDSSDEEVMVLKKDSKPKEKKISDSLLKQKNEVNEIDVRSPSTERVGKPKRLNLNASDSSNEEVNALNKDLGTKENKNSNSPLKQKNEVKEIDVPSPSTQRVDEPKRLNLNASDSSDEEVNTLKKDLEIKENKNSNSPRQDNEVNEIDVTSPSTERVGGLKRLNLHTSDSSSEEFTALKRDLGTKENKNSDSSLKQDNEIKEIDDMSPSTERVGGLKRLNLYASDSSSEEYTAPKKDLGTKENKNSDFSLKQDNEVKEVDDMSPSTERVGGLKRLNLYASDSSGEEFTAPKKNLGTKENKNSALSLKHENEVTETGILSPSSKRIGALQRLNLYASESSEDEKVSTLQNDPRSKENKIFDFSLKQDNEVTEIDGMSPSTKRIGELKRLNLYASESSEDEEVSTLQMFPESKDNKNSDSSLQQKNEVTEIDGMSPSTKRVGELKRLNLYASESSEDEEEVPTIKFQRVPERKEQSFSQNISDPSDTEESEDENRQNNNDDSLKQNELVRNITDSESSHSQGHSTVNGDKNTDSENKSPKRVNKSIKSQIEEQNISAKNSSRKETMEVQDSREIRNSEDENGTLRKSKKRRSNNSTGLINVVPTEAESLTHVSRLLSERKKRRRNFDDIEMMDGHLGDDEMETREVVAPQDPDENLPRPLELSEFVERYGLVPSTVSPTMTLKEMRKFTNPDEDEELWLMEIPKSIVIDGALCGKEMTIEHGKIQIGDVSYDTVTRNDKTISCILRKKKKPSYRTVNVRPIRSIVFRQKSIKKKKRSASTSSSSSSLPQNLNLSDAILTSKAVVPFPKNLKTRHPLLASNIPNAKKISRTLDKPLAFDDETTAELSNTISSHESEESSRQSKNLNSSKVKSAEKKLEKKRKLSESSPNESSPRKKRKTKNRLNSTMEEKSFQTDMDASDKEFVSPMRKRAKTAQRSTKKRKSWSIENFIKKRRTKSVSLDNEGSDVSESSSELRFPNIQNIKKRKRLQTDKDDSVKEFVSPLRKRAKKAQISKAKRKDWSIENFIKKARTKAVSLNK